MTACRSRASAPVEHEDVLLVSVLRRSFTPAKTDTHRLRCRNAKALRLAIELSEREANKEAGAKMKAARHAKEQDRLLRTLSGMRCSSDLTDGSTSSSDDDGPPHVDVYTEEGHNHDDHRKGKGPARKW
ncbi:Polygalacturonase ADPG1 [Hordeum vulgare]|nr:Polygalacturonase ADPG1 [Hordeum vulgare]